MASPVIIFKNASVHQGNNLILRDVNFTIEKGEFVYFIGKVGSGKTTMIKVMNAEVPLSKGEGRILEYNLNTLPRYRRPFLRRRIGVAFQEFHLLSDRNVYKNLKFVLQATGWQQINNIDSRIKQVLEYVNLPDKMYNMPSQLSGGEKQKIVIARALINDPAIIFADEPTGNVDPETSDEIMQIMKKLKENKRTVVMVTHDYSLIKKYPFRVITFKNGMVYDKNAENNAVDFEQLGSER